MSGRDENGVCELTGWIFGEGRGEGMDVEKADHKNGQLCIISFGRNLRQLCKLLLDELQSHIQSVY